METPQRLGRWNLFFSKKIQMRALKTAVLVGTVLASINHLDVLINSSLNTSTIFKIILTYCVPYIVSAYSSVLTLREKN